MNRTEKERGRHPRGQHYLALASYLVLSILVTWPVAARLSTHVAGAGVDIWEHLWTFDWVKNSVLQLQNPYYTERIFYPVGVSLASHNIAWLHILLWTPLQAFLGNIAAYNVIFIGIVAANGFATYLLAREETGSAAAAFVAGLIYALWPAILAQDDHPNMMFVTWIPLSILFLKRTLETGGRRNILLSALFIALTGWARWHLLIMAGILIGLYCLYRFLDPQIRTWENLRRLLVVGLGSAVLLLPVALPVVSHQLTREHPEDLFLDEQAEQQTDLLGFVTPSAQHSVWGTRFAPWQQRFENNLDDPGALRSAYVGFIPLFLLCVAIFAGRRSRFWVVMALVYMLLALGPILKVNGHLYEQITLPYALVQDNVLIRVLRRPDRFNVLLGLPVAAAAAFGLQRLLALFPSRLGKRLVLLLLMLAVLVEYAPVPFANSPASVPTWLEKHSADPAATAETYALIHLPYGLFDDNKHYMFYQITHNHPIMNGHVSRTPREALALWDSTALLQQIRQTDHDELSLQAVPDVSHQLNLLAEMDVRYLIIHKALAGEGMVRIWQDWLTIRPYYEDEELIVYRTKPRAGVDFDIGQSLTADVGLLRATVSPQQAVVPGGYLKVDARWGTVAAPEHSYEACLRLQKAGGEVVSERCQMVALEWPTEKWGANEVVRSSYHLPVPLALAPGDYRLSLALADQESGEMVGGQARLGTISVEPFAPAPATAAVWGEEIALSGYSLRAEESTLEVTLYWEALTQIDRSYKAFVHLVDPRSKAVVAQHDFIPHQWAYPTNAWDEGERIRDTIALPTAELGAGAYEIWTGFYEVAGGERLPVTAAGGRREAGGSLLLQRIEIGAPKQ